MTTISDRFNFFVFDLDGTLVDSLGDLASSVQHSLAEVRQPPVTSEQVRLAIGNGARKLVERCLGSQPDEELIDRALQIFLEHYEANCTRGTALYPGVRETLRALADSGRRLSVLTNKPIAMTRRILDAVDIEGFFDGVIGGDTAPPKPDPTGLLRLIGDAGETPETTLMIGDSLVDLDTAKAAGTAAAGVLFGFRPESVREAAPEFILESMDDLVRPLSKCR